MTGGGAGEVLVRHAAAAAEQRRGDRVAAGYETSDGTLRTFVGQFPALGGAAGSAPAGAR